MKKTIYIASVIATTITGTGVAQERQVQKAVPHPELKKQLPAQNNVQIEQKKKLSAQEVSPAARGRIQQKAIPKAVDTKEPWVEGHVGWAEFKEHKTGIGSKQERINPAGRTVERTFEKNQGR